MYTIDLHLKKETVDSALYNLDIAIKLAKQEKDRLLCVIVGYGSTGGTHKIRSAVVEKLNEYLITNFIKSYIFGENLDIFDLKYQKCPFKDKISAKEKREKNPGKIYISV